MLFDNTEEAHEVLNIFATLNGQLNMKEVRSTLISASQIGYITGSYEFLKEMNKFIATHKWPCMGRHNFVALWFVLGLMIVDVIDPYLFIGLWMPVGAVAALFCYKW